MAYKEVILALGLVAVAAPLSASIQDQAPAIGAPEGTPDTKYCMHIEAVTGSRIEKLKCWTREEWAEHDVDLDKDWPKEGVRTIG